MTLCHAQLHAQPWTGTGWGINLGLVAAMGNRFQRLGFSATGYYYSDFAQINAQLRAYHNFRNLGPRRQYNELVVSAGLLAGYGNRQAAENPFTGVVANQTGYNHSLGYAYNLYFNSIGTSQQTGTIAVQFGNWSILSENDIFAHSTLDRFRTGAFLVQYRYAGKYLFALNCTMWTGQMGYKVTSDTAFPYYGYMNTEGGRYTAFSHGLLSAQVMTVVDYGQQLQANAGIDAEQVRNMVQNRLIHDMKFLPRKWRNPENCHIPMLDTAGQQYLYKPGQQIRPVKPYWNLFSSPATFY